MLTIRILWCYSKIKTALLIFILLGSMIFGQSQWELGSTLPLSPFLCSVTYGNGKYLAVGAKDTCIGLISTDGVIWKYVDIPLSSAELTSCRSVAFGQGVFVVAGIMWSTAIGMSISVFASSTDCNTWTRSYWDSIQNEDHRDQINCIVFAESLFVAGGGNWADSIPGPNTDGVHHTLSSRIVVSKNGIDWRIVDSSITYSDTNVACYIEGIAYGNNSFVAVCGNGCVLSSPDGISWTKKQLNVDHLRSVTFSDDKFIVTGINDSNLTYTGKIFFSSDGLTWEVGSSDLSRCFLSSITYGNSTYLALPNLYGGGQNGSLFNSTDGLHWAVLSGFSASCRFESISYVGNLFIAIGGCLGNELYTSSDGLNWFRRSIMASNYPGVVVYGNGRYVVIDPTSPISSVDGKSWSMSGISTSEMHSLIFSDSQFITVGFMGYFATSPDGVTWEQGQVELKKANLGYPVYLNSVTHGNNYFVAVGDSGNIVSSIDGKSWQLENSGTNRSLFSISYGDGIFVVVGDSGIILTSSDHINWSIQEPDTIQHFLNKGKLHKINQSSSPDMFKLALHSVVYGNGIFVAVGDSGVILTSPNGSKWVQKKSGTTEQLISVTCVNDTFFARSSKGILLSSKADETISFQKNINKPSLNKIAIKYNRNGITALFPNSIESNTFYVKLFNSAGRMIHSSSIQVQSGRLNIPYKNLVHCLYFISISEHNNNIVVPLLITK